MSENITIAEGGVGRQFTAAKLRTSLVGGGSCDWVPESETTLGSRTITENGTYYASGDGYYGYRYVIVRGIGQASGTDGDGDDAIAAPDPETGQIVIVKVPSYILITTEPDKLEYEDGETIDYTGLVVKAYLRSGSVFDSAAYPGGVIPMRELIFPVTVADLGAMEIKPATYNVFTDTTEVLSYTSGENVYRVYMASSGAEVRTVIFRIPTGGVYFYYFSYGGTILRTHTTDTFKGYTSYNTTVLGSETQMGSDRGFKTYQLGGSIHTTNGVATSGQPVNFADGVNVINLESSSENTIGNALAYAYGSKVAGDKAVIPVQWVNPYTDDTLTDTFNITVTAAEDEDDEDQPEVDAVTGAS